MLRIAFAALILVRRFCPRPVHDDIRDPHARIVLDELRDPLGLQPDAAVRRRKSRHRWIKMQRDAARRHEPRHIRRLGMAVEMSREAGDGERPFRRASGAGAPARRRIVAIQSAQARARRTAKRPGLLRTRVWPRPSERHGMIGIFEAHGNSLDVSVRKITIALKMGRRGSRQCKSCRPR